MYYVELTCNLITETQDLLSAYLITGLGEIGFESFDEEDKLIKAYIPENFFNQTTLEELFKEIPEEFGKVSWQIEKIEQQNWNAEWEKHFNPVLIYNTVLIRASFHQNLPEFPFEILIDPKMSFGTGHHSTTALMIKTMLSMDFTGKAALDMGCGTGVLAILAKKLGADAVTAIDIDEWAYSNAEENFQLNKINEYELLHGGAELLAGKEFDIILANINRNILVNDMNLYSKSLKPGGIILISGIYHNDLDQIRDAAEHNGIQYKNHIEKNSWIAAYFIKD
jgi:ribosomal protein L11 methyltransferase